MSGEPQSGSVFGVLFPLKHLANRVRIPQALGRSREASLILFLMLARIAHGGSRLSAVRWAASHAVEDLLKLSAFDEEDLYAALDWLAASQGRIERALYKTYVRRSGKSPILVLYDVSSSYLEGEQNELAAFGYNREWQTG